MGIISALYQKRVLGLEQFVFGVFQLQTDFIDVVVGAWQNGKATIYRLGRYSLGSPPHMVEFYLTLRGINRLASEYTTELTNLGHAIGERFRIKPPKSVWAKNTGEPMKTIHEAPGESSNQEQRRGTNVQSGLSHRLSTLESWDIHDRIISYLGSTSSIISDDSAYLADTSDTSDGGLEVPQSIAGHISLEAIPKFDAVEMDRCGFVPVASTRHLAPHNSLSPSDGLDSSDDDPEFPQSPPLDMLAGQPCPNIDFVGNSKAAFREHGEMQSLDPALSA
ncbi:hypothetical protein OPQ81_009083 [Rhizoctonia solani]|nr:hypothetical protein OPQ81_009083 [Rhizoctonia solani]